MNRKPDTSRKDIIHDAQKQITTSLFLALSALAVIVFACYAWFANNTSVNAQVGSVSLSGSPFDLASVGNENGLWNSITGGDAPEEHTIGSTVFWSTTEKKNAVYWKLNGGSHLNNTESNQAGIQPGDSGTLQFYILPKRTGTLNLSFHLQIIPLDSAYVQLDKSTFSAAYNYLDGHLLFSYLCEKDIQTLTGSDFTLLDLEDKSFTLRLEITENDINNPIPVTLNWLWPGLLRNVLNQELTSLQVENPHSTVISWMKDKPEYFFRNKQGTVSAPDDTALQSRQFNNYFNNADQYIGENVDYVLLRLSAVEN